MKCYGYALLMLSNLPLLLCAQSNVGIGAPATRARLEVFSGTNPAVMAAIFGGESNGISFQQNWPGVGFNQYRNLPTGYGKYMGAGYGAVQYMNPGDGTIALDMQSVSGVSNNDMIEPTCRRYGQRCTGANGIDHVVSWRWKRGRGKDHRPDRIGLQRKPDRLEG